MEHAPQLAKSVCQRCYPGQHRPPRDPMEAVKHTHNALGGVVIKVQPMKPTVDPGKFWRTGEYAAAYSSRFGRTGQWPEWIAAHAA